MTADTAELTASATARSLPARPLSLGHRLSPGRVYAGLVSVAVAIAALSLLIPSTPSYDPWAWLVWGREIVHLKLQTTGGPTWKPLPVLFTTLFAPLGKAAPDLWLVVARTGALMAVAMVFKIALRLTNAITARAYPRDEAGGDGAAWVARSIAPTIFAAVLAAGSLVVSRGFISDNALGYSEGLMTALVAIALDRHLDGARRQAFVVGFFAALDRPELWLAWGPYGLFLWWRDPGARKLVAGLFVLIPLLWFLPEYWGSGHLFRGVSRAQQPRSNSPAFAHCPFCTELSSHAWPTLLLRMKIPALMAMAAAAFGLWRWRGMWLRGAQRTSSALQRGALGAKATLLLVGAGGFAWWLLIALLTQAGFSGNDRYLVLGAALVAIAGGVGWGWAASALGEVLTTLRRGLAARRHDGAGVPAGERGAGGKRFAMAAQGAGTLACAALFLALPPWIGGQVVDVPATHRALVYQAHLREGMTAAVARLGGPSRILRCGSVMTEGFQVPMLAWNLGVHTLRVEASPLPRQPLPPAPAVIFQTRAQRHSSLLPRASDWKGVPYRLVAHVRTFRVYSSCRVM